MKREPLRVRSGVWITAWKTDFSNMSVSCGTIEGDVCIPPGLIQIFRLGCVFGVGTVPVGTGESTCISNTRQSGEAEKVFFECIKKYPSVATGRCVDLPDSGTVCLGNGNASY